MPLQDPGAERPKRLLLYKGRYFMYGNSFLARLVDFSHLSVTLPSLRSNKRNLIYTQVAPEYVSDVESRTYVITR